MKPLLRSWSPLQLLRLVGISNAIATVTVFTLAIEKWHPHGHPMRFLPGFVLVISAFVGSFMAESALQNGIKSDLWSDAQWAMPRKLVRHPVIWVWIGVLAAFILAYGDLTLGKLRAWHTYSPRRTEPDSREFHRSEQEPNRRKSLVFESLRHKITSFR
jgi:hypothetical protein